MVNLPTLYKQGNRGLEEWKVDVVHHNTKSEIIVTWGMKDGAVQSKSTFITEGKNIGKANETSVQEQAELEAKSKWNKQIDRKGYSESIGCAIEESARKIKPMLAKVYADHKHKIKFPCYIQPKLDGMRALTYYDEGRGDIVMLSRQSKEIETTQHIKDEVSALLRANPDIVLDGELYQHGEEFQSIISKAKRDEANDESSELEYWVYDCFHKTASWAYQERFIWLTSNINVGSYKSIVLVDTTPCKSEEAIFEEHGRFVKNGFEGSIIRGQYAPYKIDGRSDQLLKLKDFIDQEFEIVGFGSDKNGHVVFNLVTDEGAEFKAKPEGTDEERREMLCNAKDYIGQLMTVKFFEWTTTVPPVPRFPVILRLYQN